MSLIITCSTCQREFKVHEGSVCHAVDRCPECIEAEYQRRNKALDANPHHDHDFRPVDSMESSG